MLDQARIVQTEAQSAAVIRITVPREDIKKVMEPGIAELLATLATQGIAPSGPLFSHHLRIDPATFDFELGVPVGSPVAAAGRVKAGSLPAATVARTVYRGPYEGLGGAWGEFCTWIAEIGRAHV